MNPTAASTLCLLLALSVPACSDSTTSPSTTASTTSPVTETFASLLAVRGNTARTFVVASAGTITVTLTSLGSGSVTAGLAVGLAGTGVPCSPSVSVITAAGATPQLVTPADAGSYCVQLFDNGTLREDTAFSVTIEHP